MVPNCSPGQYASIGTQRGLPKSNFEVDLSRSLCTMLFVMTSGNINIDLNQKVIYKTCRSFNALSNAVCRLSLRFVVFEIWRRLKRPPCPIPSLSEPARNRVKSYFIGSFSTLFLRYYCVAIITAVMYPTGEGHCPWWRARCAVRQDAAERAAADRCHAGLLTFVVFCCMVIQTGCVWYHGLQAMPLIRLWGPAAALVPHTVTCLCIYTHTLRVMALTRAAPPPIHSW